MHFYFLLISMSKHRINHIILVYKKIKEVSQKYFDSFDKIIITYQENSSNNEKEINYILRVEAAFSSLNDEGKLFINSEFFFNNYKGWWKGYYSKSQFFKLKKKYSLEFMRNLFSYVF